MCENELLFHVALLLLCNHTLCSMDLYLDYCFLTWLWLLKMSQDFLRVQVKLASIWCLYLVSIFLIVVSDVWKLISEKSVGTTELHYSTKKREHSLSILKAFFVRHSSEYEPSDCDCDTRQSMNRRKLIT